MKYLSLVPNYDKGRFSGYIVSYDKVPHGSPIGACCGSDFFIKDLKKVKHRGIVVWPSGVNIGFTVKRGVQPPVEVVTKNGTFNVSIRTAK
jgi:hypothetical protein